MPVVQQGTVSKNPISTSVECYHCGDKCPAHPVFKEAKAFCCTGCAMVYDILAKNGLTGYYKVEDSSGVNMRKQSLPGYAFLDEAGVRDRLIDFQDGDRIHVRFYLPQIHCASCIWLLERLFSIHSAILKSQVTFVKKEIQLVFDEEEISLRELVELLASLGYAPAINLSDLDKPGRTPVDRRLYFQLGVAGFAFGNIMLLSFPEYLGLDNVSESRFAQLFGYLNILIALPVVLFSARDYFRSAFQGIRHRVLSLDMPIALGISTLFLRSVYEIIGGVGAGYLDSMAGLVFFLLVGRWFQQRTFHHLSFDRDYRSYFPVSARLLGPEGETSISLDRLEPGQKVRVIHKELVPADSILQKGDALIDYSFVTGESEPVPVSKGDKIYAGGRQMGGAIEVDLVRRVNNSYLTKLWNDAAFTKSEDSRTKNLADRAGRLFTAGILIVATSTLMYWIPINSETAIHAFTSVLIIACPCAVALAIPFIFGNAIGIMGSCGFFLKNTRVIESLGQFSCTVVDKTGTLTKNNGSMVTWEGGSLSRSEKSLLASVVRSSSHPISLSIFNYLREKDESYREGDQTEADLWEEKVGKGIVARCEGHAIRLGSPAFLGMIEKAEGKAAGLMIDCQFKGWFTIDRPFRSGLEKVVDFFKSKGKLWLLSGDNDRERERFAMMLDGDGQMLFQQSPGDKLAFVRRQQESGETVLMLGDGLNDAGALSQSDTGIVMAEDSNNFTPASDAVLQASRFEDLPRFIGYAKKCIKLVYVAYGLALIYNIIGLGFAVQGLLSPVVAAILMPASSISIVLFGVGASSLMARSMGLHTADEAETGQ